MEHEPSHRLYLQDKLAASDEASQMLIEQTEHFIGEIAPTNTDRLTQCYVNGTP